MEANKVAGQTFVLHVEKGETLKKCFNMLPSLCDAYPRFSSGPGELSWPLSRGCVGKSMHAVPQMPLALTGFKPLKKRHLVFYFTPFSGRCKDVYRPELDRLYNSPSKDGDCALHLYSLESKSTGRQGNASAATQCFQERSRDPISSQHLGEA